MTRQVEERRDLGLVIWAAHALMDDLGDLWSVHLRTHRVLAFASSVYVMSVTLSIQLCWKAGVDAGYAPRLSDWESCARAMLSTKSVLASVERCELEAMLCKELRHSWSFPICAVLGPLNIYLSAHSNRMLRDYF